MSSSVLRERLRELATVGLLHADDAGLYTLTGQGRDLITSLQPLIRWAEQWGEQQDDRDV